MNRPSKEVIDAIQRTQGMPPFQLLRAWLADNLAIAQANLLHMDGPELHRTQGDARTLTAILNAFDADTGSPGRPGPGKAR